MSIYVIADTHFFHKRIIELANRPFNDVYEMNDYIIKQWNNTIKDNDIVYHLGDFGFGSVENLTNIVQSLKGYKILIMGNHDRYRSVNWWLNLGIDEVMKKPIELQEFILSHEPVNAVDKINLHGHIHGNPLSNEFNPDTHFCVSVECIDYKPFLLVKHD